MLGNNSVYAQIQKRRRRSTPNSPASPDATWQNTNTSDDLLQANSRGNSPQHGMPEFGSSALESEVPSTTFDLPTLPTAEKRKDGRSESFGGLRASEEHGQQQGRPLFEQPRPATSSSYASKPDNSAASRRGAFFSSPMDQSFSSPGPMTSHGPESPSPDVGTRYGDRTHFTPRNPSYHSVASRSPIDDMSAYKSTAGKKSRLNLLNPMSLLARRRSSQNQNSLEDAGLHVTTQSILALPDDYDPRIRGNIIHDFSAPRPRRVQSSLDSPTQQTTPPSLRPDPYEHIRRASDLAGLKDVAYQRHSQSPKYSPVFKEHFHDDRQNLRPAQTGYLHSLALSEQSPDLNSANVPAFAKKLPAIIGENLDLKDAPPSRPPPPPPLPKDEALLESVPEADAELSHLPHAPLASQTMSKLPSKRTVASSSIHRRISGVPKHMTSTSSRFSFIGNGDSAAQEKILEDRHKLHAFNRKTTLRDAAELQDEEDYEGYDFEGDDDFEERIPGVNAEDDFEEEIPGMNSNDADEPEIRRISIPLYRGNSAKRTSLTIDPHAANDYARIDSRLAFHFTPEPSGLSSNSTGATSQPTPRDEEGRIIGLAASSSPRPAAAHNRQRSDLSIMEISGGLAGLGLVAANPPIKSEEDVLPHPPVAHHEAFRDEDLYFDDGEFDDLVDEVNDNEEVDERIFDDNSEAVRDIPAENARKFEEARQRSSIDKTTPVDSNQDPDSKPAARSFDKVASSFADRVANGGLTEGNLAAYHAALVSAADTAAASGRFSRSVSNSYYSDTSTSQIEDSPPGLSDDKRNSHNVEFSGVDEDDGFDFDDDDVDDLIAEANAEVLENDDDGFYGQEFGFYARAKGKNTSELEYGGFFAPRGSNGIKRSHSAKANFQEPSLTPITERSEWSARNSVASLQIPGMPPSAHSIPSPGIAQLMDFESSSFDESMSFEALKKLRRGAFGGSSTSVNSLGGPPSSSPLAHVSAHSFAGGDASHRMTSSIASLTGSAGIPESEEEDDLQEDFRFGQYTPMRNADAMDFVTPGNKAESSPISARSERRMGHSRTSSGSESVSYVRDTDGRWLLERRRTSEDGEGEVIGREYLAGSRI